nr:hypothetical protein [Micromonospora sp. DSM 115978]
MGKRQDQARRARDRTTGDDYGPDAAEEVTLPPGDELIEARGRDLDDPADARADPDVLRDGGPTRNRGVMTTTGGRAGPASARRRPRRPGGKVAPTTTGDATTGGLSTPARSSTSDASSQANQGGNVTGGR